MSSRAREGPARFLHRGKPESGDLCILFLTSTLSSGRRWQRDKLPHTYEQPPKIERLETFHPGQTFRIGDIDITAFTIPHDAAEPCGFTFRAEGVKVGYATDLGYIPQNIKQHL